MIVLLFGAAGSSTLEVEIFEQAKVNLNFPAAIKLGAIETAIALCFVSFYTLLEQKSHRLKGISFSTEATQKSELNKTEKLFAFFVLAIVFVFFICPFFSIIYNALSSKRMNSNFTFYNFIQLLNPLLFLNSIKWTVITAGLCAFLCASFSFFYAVVLKTFDSSGRFFIFRIIPVIPMAVSSVIAGLIATLVVRRGNFLTLVFVQTFINWPVAFRQIYPAIQKNSSINS